MEGSPSWTRRLWPRPSRVPSVWKRAAPIGMPPSDRLWRASARATPSISRTSTSPSGSAGDICSGGRVMSTAAERTYTTTVGSQELELPLVALSDELTIALLITVDLGVAFAETAGRELAELMRRAQADRIVAVATMG